MARRGENIRKRKDGRWEGRIKLGSGVDGKTIYKSLYSKTYKEVKEKMNKYKKEELHINVKNNKNLTFGDMLNQWKKINSIKNKGTTDYKYSYLINKHILPSLKNVKIGEINSEIVTDFLVEKLSSGRLDKKGGLSPSYVRTMMVIINSTLNYSYEQGYSKKIKTKSGLLPLYKTPPKTLSLTEQRTLEKHLRNNINSTNVGILLALQAGLRVGEICALSWENIDFNERIMHIRNTVIRTNRNDNTYPAFTISEPKTKSSIRDIPLTDCLLYNLMIVKSESISPYVISGNSEFVSPNTFEYRYHKALNQFNIKDINFHALRHTFATRCIEAGVDDKTLSEILGHANVSITLNTYVHSSMDLKRSQLEKFSMFINNK